MIVLVQVDELQKLCVKYDITYTDGCYVGGFSYRENYALLSIWGRGLTSDGGLYDVLDRLCERGFVVRAEWSGGASYGLTRKGIKLLLDAGFTIQ